MTGMNIQKELQLLWLSSNGMYMEAGCQLVHQGPCSMQILRKLKATCTIGARYYIFFHLFPLLIGLKKAQNSKERSQVILKAIKQYGKSILFMGFLVSGLKASLCFCSSKVPMMLDGSFIFGGSAFSSFSIFLQHYSRRSQITYFIFARALAAAYRLIKRRGFNYVSNQAQWLHILLLGICYWVYCYNSSLLKPKWVFEELWGQN